MIALNGDRCRSDGWRPCPDSASQQPSRQHATGGEHAALDASHVEGRRRIGDVGTIALFGLYSPISNYQMPARGEVGMTQPGLAGTSLPFQRTDWM